MRRPWGRRSGGVVAFAFCGPECATAFAAIKEEVLQEMRTQATTVVARAPAPAAAPALARA